MADGYQQTYAEIMGATLRGLGSPSRARLMFMRGFDEGDDGGAYLMCVAVGPNYSIEADGRRLPIEREVVGFLRYADGRRDGPQPVLDDAREALLRDVGFTA